MDTSEFLQKRADDVMVRDVTVLRRDDTMAHAADTFLCKRISGAPVVDADGKCVGVLSATDILGATDKATQRQVEVAEAFFSRPDLLLPTTAREDDLAAVRDKTEPAAELTIEDFMIKDIVWVRTDDTIERVARDFLDARIHRVLVIDTDGKLAGLITTVDVIAALLQVPISN